MTNYFRNHIAKYSFLSAPLTALCKGNPPKKQGLLWVADTITAFQALRQAVIDAPMLNFLRDDGQVILYTDASDYACGGHLVQVIQDEERTITFVSTTLSAVQRRWSTIEKEMFAVFYCVKKLHYYIGARPFTLRTDHNNLKYWLTPSASAKVERWRVFLQEYDMHIEHVKGVNNPVADALSRVTISYVTRSTTAKALGESEAHVSRGDTSTTPPAASPPPEPLVNPEPSADTPSMSPADIQTHIHNVHNSDVGHHGWKRTKRILLEKNISWPGMYKDIIAFIRSCPICQKLSDKPSSSHGSEFTLSTAIPNQRIAMDTCGPFTEDAHGYIYILVIIDCFSKWVELYPLKSTTAEECARTLLRYYGTNGIPAEVLSDQGTQFHNQLLAAFSQLLPTQQVFTIANNSRQNGLAENAIKRVRRHLQDTLLDRPLDTAWSDVLPIVQHKLNTTVNESTSYSPATIRFGHFNALKGPFFTTDMDASKLSTWLQAVTQFHSRVQENVATSVQKHSDAKDTTTHTSFAIGSYVLVDTDDKSRLKGDLLHLRRTGPYKVISQAQDKVTVQDLNNPSRTPTVHVSRCRPYISRPNEDLQREALRGSSLYIVDEILSHKVLSHGKRKTLTPADVVLTVKWRGYSESSSEPLSNMSIRNSAAFVRYAQNKPQLQPFIKTTIPGASRPPSPLP
jgi:hypothetical protein